jgi:hypothetical protein
LLENLGLKDVGVKVDDWRKGHGCSH